MSQSDMDRFLKFEQENRMLANGIGIFSTMRMAEMYPLAEAKMPLREWEKGMCACTCVPMTALYAFAYDEGIARLLNLLMMQTLCIDRKASPIMQGRLLSLAMSSSIVEGFPLHILWFVTRWQEWKGSGNWEEMIGSGDKFEASRKPGDPTWQDFLEGLREQNNNAEQIIQKTIATIAARVAAAQAQDFDVDAQSIEWWQEIGKVPGNFLDTAYWPAPEIEEVIANSDPVERRRLAASVKTLKGIELPPFLNFENHFEMGKAVRLNKLRDPELYEDYFGDLLEYIGIYMYFRSMQNEHPSQNLLWYIMHLHYLNGMPTEALAIKLWRESHKALDSHVPPIWGLWLLDLGRQLLHKGVLKREFGQEMAWIHAKERKFVGMLERGDFGSES